MVSKQEHPWWKQAVGYQIYPASFKDSNCDGIGDINGITQSLDYLRAVGVDFIWISPIYDSPDHDMGYDICDYETVAAKYGTMEDMNCLLQEAKKRGLRVLMDLVVNHTSAEHSWFKESRLSKTGSKSDWYIWRDPRYDENGERKPPSNWRAHFGGSTWTYEPSRDQYYFHLFLEEQPDLNWHHKEVRQAIYASAIKFWLDKGVDGFRVDMVNAYWKHPDFPDVPIVDTTQECQPFDLSYILNGEKVHEWLQELRSEVLDPYGRDIVLIGELPGTPPQEVLRYLSPAARELDMTIDGMFIIAGNHWALELHDMRRHRLPELKDAMALTQGLLKQASAWTTAFLENHDVPRSISHLGPGEGPFHKQAAKTLALLNTTLSGTLIVYQGQEIGMTNVNKGSWRKEDFRDRAIQRYFRDIEARYPGNGVMQERALQAAIDRGRDNTRTLMQWSADKPSAGFATGNVTPWIRANPNFEDINVDAQLRDEHSVLAFWKRAVTLRKRYPDVFIHGEFCIYDRENEQTFSYWKILDAKRAFVVLNFCDLGTDLQLPAEVAQETFTLLVSTTDRDTKDAFTAALKPWEGRIYINSA
jgi:alpha-glucosidase